MKRIISVLALVLLTASVHATIVHVPADQGTIQAGIDAALAGDTVLVAAGTYTGTGNRDLSFGGQNIVLMSESGAAATVIDCQGSAGDPHVGISLDNGEDSTAVIDGFTITNAYGTGFSAAVFLLHASATVQNCIITNCAAFAIANSNYSTATVVRNTDIVDNLSSGIIFNREGIIENCRVLNNQGQGVFGSAKLTITGTVVAGNFGFGVSNINGAPQPMTMTNCTVVDNEVGLWYEVELPKSATDRQIDVVISECIIAFNREQGVKIALTGAPQISCCDVFGNPFGNYEIDPFYTLDTSNCISRDPEFCGAVAQNYTLGALSPCRPSGNVCGVQIGAFGVGCSCCRYRGDVNHDGQVNIADLTRWVCIIFGGFCEPAPCTEEVDIDGSGALNISDLTYFVAFLFQNATPPPPC